ncbi:hypothetical protein [Solitalea lacus]|uniref:hypothetical protein n=1 Tax=Solitalea lacus TaxID=2911172 RepID=UPI001EDC5D8C|nr:hypothetical protein [Solitalea lacus]UKJ07494.1 glycosyl transferase [Solitalea lacus]
MSQIDTYDDITIPTYIINLKERVDRLTHIKKQFDGKREFDVTLVEACKHEIGAVGLWQSIVKIVKLAMANDEDVIIICEDDHEFTASYSKQFLLENIIDAHDQGINILSGGVSGFNLAVPITENRYWINSFWGTQFLVIYKKFFQTILDEKFTNEDTADGKFSEMTSNKMTLYPFISIQKDFGYSDVTKSNQAFGNVAKLFEDTAKRFEIIMTVYHRYRSGF